MDRSEIVTLLVETAKDLAITSSESLGERELQFNEDTHLIGRDGVFDSMGLVNLILDVEQIVNDRYSLLISLADERAMSQKHSPFRSIGSLADYILTLISETKTSQR